MTGFDRARALLREFKGNAYLHGFGVLPQVGRVAAEQGRHAALVRDVFPGSEDYVSTIVMALEAAGVEVLGTVQGAAPNAPLEDLARIHARLVALNPDVIVSFGGGSTIDAAKAAEVLRALGGTIEDYFGTGLVTKALASSGKALTPHVAIQTAASSGAHLTKYSNITDVSTGQKKLIVDEAIVPARPVFDYEVTTGAPASLTCDGALDGVSHSLEVLYSAVGKPYYQRMEDVAGESFRLVLEYLPKVLRNPEDPVGREALGLATDLGGYAIMLGGTNGPHLTSFSLVDVLTHGRACAMMQPYYMVFFAPAVEGPLKLLARVLRETGHAGPEIETLEGRALGMAVARTLVGFYRGIGLPATLAEVPGFGDGHIARALAAAKNPQLKMKLENMPVPLTAEMVDDYMGPILQAAKSGELDLIRNVA